MADVVEKWISIPAHPAGGIRRDLFGFIDLVCLTDHMGCMGIQATSTGNLPSRIKKSKTECVYALMRWLEHGNKFEVWGWAKRGKVGKRKLWTLRRVELQIQDGVITQHEIQG